MDSLIGSSLSGIVSSLLARVLGKYVDGLEEKNMKLKLFGGEASLSNLKIKKNLFEKMNLPFQVKEGTLGKLKIKIPWSSLSSSPVVLQIEDLFLLLDSKRNLFKEEAEQEFFEREKETKANVNSPPPSSLFSISFSSNF